jgi:hypothetical protein
MTQLAKWWADWQSTDHAAKFDFRASVPRRVLIRDFESFNDVRLLNEILKTNQNAILLEVGCATGGFYRYIHTRYPKVMYRGVDVSMPAVDHARSNFPDAQFSTVEPDWSPESLIELSGGLKPQIVFCKDVVHHQVDPLEFLSRLLKVPCAALIFRTRTRDAGPTEWDPEKSCQYHYRGWMPYIVMNITELIDQIRQHAPAAEITICRNHMVLGGKHNRYLSKECYLEQTGTAETAVRVSLVTRNPGSVTIVDRLDANPQYSAIEMFQIGISKIRKIVS